MLPLDDSKYSVFCDVCSSTRGSITKKQMQAKKSRVKGRAGIDPQSEANSVPLEKTAELFME